MKAALSRIHLITFVVIAAFVGAAGQKPAAISERNVRAGMIFLAGDAMQGRGSGTQFERIAAEYIGSQFMQFGLEPAGEVGPDGKPTFIQSITYTPRRGSTSHVECDRQDHRLG